MGAVELQIFVSLVVVLGAAFVALICDFLKGSNEQLREANIELRVRQDERQRGAQPVQRQKSASAPVRTAKPAPVRIQPVPQPVGLTLARQPVRPMPEPQAAPMATPAVRRVAPVVAMPIPAALVTAAVPLPVPTAAVVSASIEREFSATPAAAAAPPVAEPAAEPAAAEPLLCESLLALAASVVLHGPAMARRCYSDALPLQMDAELPAPVLEAQAPVFDIIESVAPAEEETAPLPSAKVLNIQVVRAEVEPEPATGAVATAVLEPEPLPAESFAPALVDEIAPLDVESRPLEPAAAVLRSNLVSMPEPVAEYLRPDSVPQVVPLQVPGGWHDTSACQQLLADRAPFTGLALCFSLSDFDRLIGEHGRPAMEDTMAALRRVTSPALRESDFACRVANDEFLLVFPGETGAQAKRRTQTISERLWDYQLRSLGAVPVMLHWGAQETQAQPLADAVARARGQMLETSRSRRTATTGAGRFRRVANG